MTRVTNVPSRPKIYHITHVDNLPSILADGGLFSDSMMASRGGPTVSIGLSHIKQQRLRTPLRCHPGDFVGEYVPFNFCPRSVMLYPIYSANHPELSYRGGQKPILHLEADLQEAVTWAESEGRRWAFSLSNSRAAYTEFRTRLDQLGEVDWQAVGSSDFRNKEVKERKQAEFLVHSSFPWHLVRRIGVHSGSIELRVRRALPGGEGRPIVEVRRDWYY